MQSRFLAVMIATAAIHGARLSAQDLASDALSAAGSHAGTVGVNSHLGRDVRGASREKLTVQNRKLRAAKSSYRARFGKNDPRVIKLYNLCGRAGM